MFIISTYMWVFFALGSQLKESRGLTDRSKEKLADNNKERGIGIWKL